MQEERAGKRNMKTINSYQEIYNQDSSIQRFTLSASVAYRTLPERVRAAAGAIAARRAAAAATRETRLICFVDLVGVNVGDIDK